MAGPRAGGRFLLAYALVLGPLRENPGRTALAIVAIALGVVDLVAYIEGDRPISWSTTIDVGRADLPRTLWKRHPLCGCTWGDDLPIILA